MTMERADADPRIDLYSHHFTVTNIDERVQRAIAAFSRGLIEWDRIRVPPFSGRPHWQMIAKRIYASAKADRSEIRFHINHLEGFKAQLKANHVPLDKVIYVSHPLYEPQKIELVSISGKVLREEQVPVVEYLSQLDDIRGKVVTAPTGTGKSVMTMRALINLGFRTVFVINATYIEKWVEDIYGKDDDNGNFIPGELAIAPGEFLVVRGSADLRSLMNLALSNELTAKIIIIGNRTFQNYIKSYERDECFADMYSVHPEQFYEVLKAGIRVIDEVHQDFHLNFKQDTYAHIPYTISLSATLEADQQLLNDMYQTMWPLATRGPEIKQKKYIIATCLLYTIERHDDIRCTNHKRQYSHVIFEQSIMRNKYWLKNYLKIPEMIVRNKYIPDHLPGQKMLIFASTVVMCTMMRDHLRKQFPQFKIARYVGEDDWENLHNNDIVVTTIQSAGTAVDIANLRYTLMTVALSNKQTNIQVIGRLRELKNYPGVEPEFMFLACQDIGKHMEYAGAKQSKLSSKVKHFTQSYLPVKL